MPPPSSMAFLVSPDTVFCALSSLATVASVHGGEEDLVFDTPVVREAEDLRAPCRPREMDVVCEECGAVGAKDLLLRCSKCKSAARHRYCLDVVIFDSVVEWLCSDCIPKHNESIKSSEGASNQRQRRNIKEPNAEKEKVTIAWGLHRNRHRKRKNHVDGSTIHSPSRDTSNQGRNRPHKESGDAITTQSCSGDVLYSCAIFGGDIPNRNDGEIDGENRNGHLICTVESSDVEKSEPLKAIKGLEESVVASTFAPNRSKLMQGSHLKTGNADVLKPINQRLDSWSRVPMQSSPSNELEDTTVQENNAEGTRCLADAETLAPILNNCTSNHSMANERLVSNEGNSVEANRRSDFVLLSTIAKKMQKRKSVDREIVNSCKVNEISDPDSDEVLLSTIAKKMQRRKSVDREIVNSCMVNEISDPDSAQGDPDASIAGMTSYLGLLQEEGINSELLQSSPSNELEDVAIQENSAERTRCLVDEETNTPIMENLQVSKPFIANECLVSDEGNSDKASTRSDDVLLSTEGKRMLRQVSADREIVNFHKVNGISNRSGCEKEGEGRNRQLTCAVESDGSNDLPLDHVSEFEPNNLQKAMDGSKLASNSVECTDFSSVRSGCFASSKCVEGLVPQGRVADTSSLTNDVEGSLPMIVEKSRPTSASLEQAGLSVNGEKSEPLKADKELEKSVVASKFAPNRSKPIQGSDLETGSAVVLNPLKQCLGSCSMVPTQSSPSNELEDVAVQENSAERTRCLVDGETNAPKMENLKVSKPSMANDCLVSNEGSSDKASRRSDEVLLSTKGKRMLRRVSADREIVSSHKVNGISNPESAKGDRDARNIQRNAGQPSSLDVKKAFQKQALQEEAINSELSSPKFVSPCESTKMNPRKRKQSESYSPDGIKYPKASIINEKKNVNAARSKSRRPAPVASLGGCQNMPRKDNGSKDKGVEHCKKGKNKKMDKSWLARKASEGSRKTPSDLQAPSLRSSVYKSIPCLESMDLALKESSCPLNNPRGSCASRVTDISSIAKELHNDSEPKKRKRRRQDSEALHVTDLNSRSCDDGHVKQQRKCVEKVAKNPRRYIKDEEALRLGNLNQQPSNYYKQVNKQRRIRNLNAGCAENDVSQLALQTGVTEGRSDTLRTPLISESTGVQPLDEPYWTGIMKIDKNFLSLSAHLSIKAGKKVQELSRSLPPMMKVTKLSTLKSCPKHLETPIPSADSIDLYFFCGDTRPNKELDQLVKHVADSGIILEAIVGSAKLCLFPSFALPEEYQTFQGKPYLWGFFKPRKDKINRLAPVGQDCTAHVTEEEHVQDSICWTSRTRRMPTPRTKSCILRSNHC